MSASPVDLAAYRQRRTRQRRREDALLSGEVLCPRCKAPVFGTAKRCGSCGVHFKGRAEDFAPRRRSLWFRLVLGLLLLSILVAALGFG